jgi:hypothetical protein
MSEKVTVLSNIELEEKYVRRPFEMCVEIGRPASLHDTAAQADAEAEPIEDDDIHDFGNQLDCVLESMTPIEYALEPDKRHNWSVFRLPDRYEPFTIVGKPIEVSCHEIPMHHECGHYTGEAYFPIDSVLLDQLKVPTRIVALHPAISYPDKPFILIQPRERRGSESSGRDDSLEKALSTAPGNWMQLGYDEETDCFEFCHSEQDPEDAPEYPGFVWDCLNALGECFDDEPEHPLQIFIREQQRLHSAG